MPPELYYEINVTGYLSQLKSALSIVDRSINGGDRLVPDMYSKRTRDQSTQGPEASVCTKLLLSRTQTHHTDSRTRTDQSDQYSPLVIVVHKAHYPG